ncbi:MAG: hypothetical protein SPL64_03155 [Bacteroidaceae bacterium]|nr:hypothetical protein [Bacteroidaceae bacterium]
MKKLFLLAMLCLALGMSAQTDKNAKPVYAFGYAISFSDSVITLTATQALPSAQLTAKSKFLKGINLYSAQLKQHMVDNLGGYPTCTIFYHTNRAKLEKRYAKLKKSILKAKDYQLKELGPDEFAFKAISNEAIEHNQIEKSE